MSIFVIWRPSRPLYSPVTGYGGGILQYLAFDPSTTAWVNAVVANGGTVTAGRETTVNNLITSLKQSGVWNKFDRLWLLANEASISSRTDITAAHDFASITGSPTFTIDRGWAGVDVDPPGSYLVTTFTPSTATNFALNSAHFSGWSVTNTATTAGGAWLGAHDATNLVDFYNTFTDGNLYPRVNATGSGSAANTGRTGHWITTRNAASGAGAVTVYQNATSFMTDSQASSARPTTAAYLLAINNNGTAEHGTPNQIAAVSFGSGLTSTDVTSFYTALRTYMTAVGVP